MMSTRELSGEPGQAPAGLGLSTIRREPFVAAASLGRDV